MPTPCRCHPEGFTMSTTEKTTKETSEQTEPEPYKYKCIRIQYPPHPDTELRAATWP